jgi:ligand-binding sensor domain-containing protein
MKKAVLLFCVLILTLSGNLWSKHFDGWQSYTSTKKVNHIAYFEDSLQILTSGGWLKVDPQTGAFRKLVNTDGIGTNELYHVIKDTYGTVWLAGNGRLNRIEGDQVTPFLFRDFNDQLMTLYSLADDGAQLWVGTSKGLALFSKVTDGGQIEDIYFRFGDLNTEASVYDIVIIGDTIWLATADGVAFSDKSNPDLLKSFANWATVKPTHHSASVLDSVFAIVSFMDQLYIGTAGDVFALNITETDTILTDIPTRDNVTIKEMRVFGDSLYIYTSNGFFIFDGSSVDWSVTPSIPDDSFGSGYVVNDVHWVGSYVSGTYFEGETEYQKLEDGSLPGNNVTALATSQGGLVIGAFQKDGVAEFDGMTWEPVPISNIRDGMVSAVYDDPGHSWLGSWGGGLYYNTGDEVINYTAENSILRGVSGASYYVVINRLSRSSSHIFMSNVAPDDENTVRWVNMYDTTKWGSFGSGDGLPPEYLTAIAANDEIFVVGTPDKGIYYYYYGPDIGDRSDDSLVNLTDANSRLGSDEILSIAFDNENILWVGTKYGLARYDIGIDLFVTVNLPSGFGPEVSHLVFDSRGNIWMGASNGLANYKAVTGEIDIYTSLNSGLPDDYITALDMNPYTGDLWIGTRKGISRFSSRFGTPTNNIEQVVAFPNPFIIRNGDDFLSFNYNGRATVRIFSVNGELVWEDDINVPWYGRNRAGENVAGGVYLCLLTAEDGTVGRGKILLIRE